MSRLLCLTALAAVVALAPRAGAAQAQAGPAVETPYTRALELEQQEKYRDAATAYREALAHAPSYLPAILGLERVYAQLGWSDSLLTVLDAAIALQPRDPTLRSVQLRTLNALGDPVRVRTAFERWRREVPTDAAPFREYARVLMGSGQTAAADSLLRRAQLELGSGRGLELELAQLRASMGMWDASATAWRGALGDAPYLEQAAVFSLAPAPQTARVGIRLALVQPPLVVTARRALAALELQWGNSRAAWLALRDLRPDTAGINAWIDFARRAEEASQWLVARDALAAALAVRGSGQLGLRAAIDALNGGDPRSALALIAGAEQARDTTTLNAVLPIRLRALAALGRADEAERTLAASAAKLTPEQRTRMGRIVAWAWVRAGDVTRARALLGGDPADAADDAEVSGWLALYEGDLAGARRQLRPRGEATPQDLVLALSFLSRTRADSAPAAGRAFLALARGDSARAAASFEEAAATTPDAAPLLALTAARLYAQHHEDTKALALWSAIVSRNAESPEAPEAELEWARALRRAGSVQQAIDHLEHLILTYPQSALVPQARRELELARGGVAPPTSSSR